MLEAEEVDVDYFTPSSSTSLSKIFGSNAKEEDVLGKTSLKYNAPLPPQIVTKPEEPKQTQYLFAGTVYAYEWVNNTYELRGRLGFAIFKIAGFDSHNMVIYDSNKTTLSSLTITQNVEIKVNGNISISYYDNLQKFWSVNPSRSNLNEILDILNSLNVKLEFVPPVENTENRTITDIKKHNDEKESDTDGSFNKKTKDSILKRMATMGQSVLPPPHIAPTQTSDSSDTNEPLNQQKPRHKPKVMSKKIILEKKILDTERISELNAIKIPSRSEISHETYEDVLNIDKNQQIVPVMTTNIIKPSIDFSGENNSLGLFITEQKINNSELRININRMTDKLDVLLDKVRDLEINDKCKPTNHSNGSHTQFQNDIVQKLLNEYEKKINKYEEFIKSQGYDCNTFEIAQLSTGSRESFENIHVEDKKLLQLCNEKDEEICRLKQELQLLSNRQIQSEKYEKSLSKEIEKLKINNNVTAMNTRKILDDTNSQHNTHIQNKLKEIMNDTFQAISANFDDEEQYTGAKVKSIVGIVVKKTTIESLKEFQ